MNYQHIVLLPDLFRGHRAASEGFFAFMREPIRQGCGINPGWPPTAKKPSTLLPGFDLQKFRALAGWNAMHATEFWRQTWRAAPAAAVDYLFAHVPPASLVLSYDMPPWLAQACAQRGIDWLDMRPSPLAFGRDLYVALRASDATLQKRLAALCVTDEELRLEAAMLAANLHAHRLEMEEGYRYRFNLDGSLLFIGQPCGDAALLSPQGHTLCCTDFSAQLRTLAKGKTVLHLLDARHLAPSSLNLSRGPLHDHVQQERATLERMLETPVRTCQQNLYQVLSTHDDVALVGISAPALQEAMWFGKTAHTLFRPYTPLTGTDTPQQSGYVQAHFRDVLSPAFWHATLSPDTPPPRLPALPELERSQARTALNHWGGYEQVTTWERPLHHASFERSGGSVLRQRIEKLEQVHGSPPPVEASDETIMRLKIRALKDTKKGLTAYVLGNAPSLNELDISALLQAESFWCNRAYKMEQQGIEFLPKYYFLSDRMAFQEFGEHAMAVKAQQKFFREQAAVLARQTFPQDFDEQGVIAYGSQPSPMMFEGEGYFSTDPSLVVNGSFTIIMDAIQFAFYMGFEKVYVGGVDLDYSGTPYFFGGQAPDYVPFEAVTENMKKSFIVARRHFEKHGRVLAKITYSPNLPLDYINHLYSPL